MVDAPTSVDIVIVNYNTRDQLDRCLGAALATHPDKLVVIDNASADGSAAMVRQRYPDTVLHANPRNLGYGGAANLGLASCNAPYTLLLNADTVVPPDALPALRSYLDAQPRVAVVGPRLVGPDWHLQLSCYPFWLPAPITGISHPGTLKLIRRLGQLGGRRVVPTSWETGPQTVPWVVGAAIAIRREAVQLVGGFDESFFLYCEEVDLCRRLIVAGWEIHYAPVTTIMHVGGASTKQRGAEMAVEYFASTLMFYARHYPGLRLRLLALLIGSIAVARWTAASARVSFGRDATQRARLEKEAAAWRRLLGCTRGYASRAQG